MCVHPVIPPARKPLETAVQTTSGCCQCPVSRSLLPSGPVLFLPTLSPPSLLPLLADTDCCGHGDGATKAQGSKLCGHLWPISCGEPSQHDAWCWRKLQGRVGRVTCWWRVHWPFLGGQLPRPGSYISSQVSGVPNPPCEWDSVPWVVLSSGLAWCPQTCVLSTSRFSCINRIALPGKVS